MLEHAALQVNPIWGIVAVIVAGFAIVAFVVQLVAVKKSEWDKHANLVLENEQEKRN